MKLYFTCRTINYSWAYDSGLNQPGSFAYMLGDEVRWLSTGTIAARSTYHKKQTPKKL